MALPDNSVRKLKEVFPKSRKEFEDETRLHSLDFWPGMEAFLDMPDIALPSDPTPNNFTPSDEIPSTTPIEKGPPTTPPKKGPPTTLPIKKPPTTPSEVGPPNTPSEVGPPTTTSEVGPPNTTPKKGPPTTPSKEGSIMKLLDKKPFKTTNPPIRAFDNVQKVPRTAKPFDRSPTSKPLNDWKHEDIFNQTDWFPKYNYKFVFVEATQPPLTRAINAGALVVKALSCAVGFLLVLMVLSTFMDRKHRTRREVVLPADANAVEQNLQTDERTSSEPGEPEPLNNDLPPSYYECTPYSMNEGVGEGPPPYTNFEYHKQQQDGFVKNEPRACFEEVAPAMRMELVFDSGRILERQSLDANSNNNKTREASNDNVEK